jgi:hypothetical protein
MPFAPRFLRTPGLVKIAGRHIKRYHVNIDDRDIEPAIVNAACEFLPRLLPPEADATPPATAMVLHRGRDAAYLLAYSWVWDNVIECHTAAAGSPFLGCPDRDVTHFVELTKPWIGCIWELPALAHERSAWVRHMLSAEPANFAAYLADSLPEGPIG